MDALRRVGVFCGSSEGSDPGHVSAAARVGRDLAAAGIELVYGGLRTGLMGTVADACLDEGGRVTGVVPAGLFAAATVHPRLSALVEVPTLSERKERLYELADAFVVLPGGLGTLDELSEVLTWVQLGLLAKPMAVVDVDGYYGPLRSWFERAVGDGYVRAEYRRSLLFVPAGTDLVGVLVDAQAAMSAMPVTASTSPTTWSRTRRS